MKQTVTQVMITVALVLVIVVEFVVGVKQANNTLNKQLDVDLDYIHNMSRPDVILAEDIYTFEEVPYPDATGDTVDIEGIRLRVNGTVTSKKNSGYIDFSRVETAEPVSLRYIHRTESDSAVKFQQAYSEFFKNEVDAILSFLPINYQKENLAYYQQTMLSGDNIPIVYDSTTKDYYMFTTNDDFKTFYVLSCKEPFCLSTEKLSIHYNDYGEDYLEHHNFGIYEVAAIANQRALITDGNYYGPATTTTVSETSDDTYTSETDRSIRDMLVSYARYQWKPDGTSDDTRMTIDITSASAVDTTFHLSAEVQAYTKILNGLTLNGLHATRDPNQFMIEGKVTNTLSTSRPWVLVVKYIGDGQLLGLSVVDNRQNALAGGADTTWSVTVTKEDNVEFSKITDIQFEMR